MTTVPPPASPLLLLPDELLQTITDTLLPAMIDREKPREAIRFGATCRRLHALVLPIAFKVSPAQDDSSSSPASNESYFDSNRS